MILITTAGKVGSEAARVLAQRREPVRILVRNPEKAAALDQVGADVFEGDLDAPATVNAAMQGVTSVVLVTAPIVHQELGVIDAAVRAGVEHVVKITSKASADSPIARPAQPGRDRERAFHPITYEQHKQAMTGRPAASSSSPPTTQPRSFQVRRARTR